MLIFLTFLNICPKFDVLTEENDENKCIDFSLAIERLTITMAISDSVALFETSAEIKVVIDDRYTFTYPVSAENPRRSDDF